MRKQKSVTPRTSPSGFFSFTLSLSRACSPSFPRASLPFHPFTRSYPLSLPRRRSSPLVSLPVSFSRYATTKLLSFLLPFPCSPRPYLVTHKRLACNSPRVYVCTHIATNRRVSAAFVLLPLHVHARVESRGSRIHACTNARMHASPQDEFRS